MTKTLTIPSSVNIHGKKAITVLYRDYCAAVAKETPDEQPMLAKDFEAIVEKSRSEKTEFDKVRMTPETKDKLEGLGWKLQTHSPKSGPQKGESGIYLVNDEATVSGAGFLRMNRTRLVETQRRLQDNLKAIDMVLKG